jgi:ribosome assembly protein RRB1
MKKKEQIDVNFNKEIIVETNKKKNEKTNEIGKKKKREAEDDLETMMQCDYLEKDKMLSKKFEEKLDIEEADSDENEEEYLSESDPDEEVLIDEDHYDNSDDSMDHEDQTIDNTQKNLKVNIWDENKKLKEDMQLDFDNEAYEMLHRSKVEWPCMTIDFMIPQNFNKPINSLPQNYNNLDFKSLDTYPYTCYMVAGAQTNTKNGYLYCMKWFNMHKTKYDDDPDKGADSEEEDGQEPFMKYERVQVKGNINKIKTLKNSNICAYWSDSACVEILNLKDILVDLEEKDISKNNKNKKRKIINNNQALKTFNRKDEGFALEWSLLTPGVLAAGGLDKILEIYIPTDETYSDWILNSQNLNNNFGVLKGHKGSIEDVIWSPVQPHVLSTCSTDKSIRFWDLRSDKNSPPIILEKAHDSDVNCISWNNFCEFMVASGGEDNSFKVWDIRYVANGPISNILWHKGPITSLAWDPFDDSQIAVASEDNRLSVWDFSVEPDDKQLFDSANQEIPQQLIFLHQGQENIKDLKFHPIYKNLITSTAENGINVFRPAFDEDSSIASDEMMDIEN